MMEKVNVVFDDGFELEINKKGKGPALIIQHGWTGTVEDWMPIIKRLCKNFTCYFWNCRTYHQEGVNLERLATDVQNLITQEKLSEVALVGHSMGALISWEYVTLFGCDKLRLLTIVDQSPKLITDDSWSLGLYRNYTDKDNLHFEENLEKDFRKTVVGLYLNSQILTPEEVEFARNTPFMQERAARLDNYNDKAWITTWKSLSRKDYRETLKKITVPTYLAYGDKCKFYGVDVGNYVAENIPNSHLHIYKGSGHHPHSDYAEDFAEKVKEYYG